jgi:putative transposase
MRYELIEEEREGSGITHMCRALNVSPSGYYAWRGRTPSAREMANRELLEKIEAVYHEHHGVYGSPRIHRELVDGQGVACSENRVARLMRAHGLQAKQSKRFRTTTKRNKADPVAPNLLGRNFQAEGPDETWLADITYIATGEGWLYLAVIMDLYTRRIVGWAMSDRMTSDLTLAALDMALLQRDPDAGLMHHSDQGSQYTNKKYQGSLKARGIRSSMNGVGSWYDNAPMESFFATLKCELVYHCAYRTRDEAKADVFHYIEAFYNRRRRHSALAYLSPEVCEQLFHSGALTSA